MTVSLKKRQWSEEDSNEDEGMAASDGESDGSWVDTLDEEKAERAQQLLKTLRSSEIVLSSNLNTLTEMLSRLAAQRPASANLEVTDRLIQTLRSVGTSLGAMISFVELMKELLFTDLA